MHSMSENSGEDPADDDSILQTMCIELDPTADDFDEMVDIVGELIYGTSE